MCHYALVQNAHCPCRPPRHPRPYSLRLAPTTRPRERAAPLLIYFPDRRAHPSPCVIGFSSSWDSRRFASTRPYSSIVSALPHPHPSRLLVILFYYFWFLFLPMPFTFLILLPPSSYILSFLSHYDFFCLVFWGPLGLDNLLSSLFLFSLRLGKQCIEYRIPTHPLPSPIPAVDTAPPGDISITTHYPVT
ncbi:hypothetical protein PLICRDRAFT_645448 [Plicaturopsis crispa FD-325 SS-3]|nr:hypothetical protein PLICRDRAFT_645448 [Plicaturopsis crispa FD-325 SS-3]